MAVEVFLGTRAQRGFIGTVILQAIIVLTMVAIAFGLVSSNVDTNQTQYKTLPCYLAMFALAELFHLVMSLDALKLRNIIQLFGILIFHAALLVFSAIQIRETHDALVTKPGSSCTDNYATCSGPDSLYALVFKFLIVVPIILGISLGILMIFVRELYLEFGWAVFHHLGADPQLKRMYRFYQIMICLLKFDFFCFVGVTMQLLILVLAGNTAEFVLTIVAIPVVLILLIVCGIAVQREIKWLMTVSLVLMLGAEAYFLYKFCRLFMPASRDQYVTTRKSLAVFLVVSFSLLFATFAVGLRCFADFDKGLRTPKTKDAGTDIRQSKIMNGTPMTSPGIRPNLDNRESYVGGSSLQNRMSIE